MNITIIGASAGVGLETVKRALNRNHCVTTLSRSSINLPHNKDLTCLKGSALNRDDLERSIEFADAVIITLGTGKSMKPTTIYSGFAQLLIDIQKMKVHQIPVVVLTGFGAGNSASYNTLLMRIFFRLFLKGIYDDKTRMEELISKSNLRWVIVRPGLLKDGPLTEEYRIATALFPGINIGSINRADVADYMVKQAEHPTELFKYPALSKK